MKTLDMLKLFYEYLETANETFKNIDRPSTDTVLRLLNDSYLQTLDNICRAETFPLSAQKVGANLEAVRKLVLTEYLTTDGTRNPNISYIQASSLSGQYAYFVKAEVEITRTAVPVIDPAEYVEVNPIHEKETQALLATIYNKPIIRVPGITFIWDTTLDVWNFAIYTDIYSTISIVRLTYVKVPDPLNNDNGSTCDLEPESLCHDVVKKAVDGFINAKAVFAPQPQQTEE